MHVNLDRGRFIANDVIDNESVDQRIGRTQLKYDPPNLLSQSSVLQDRCQT
jgi:hypothetical protein